MKVSIRIRADQFILKVGRLLKVFTTKLRSPSLAHRQHHAVQHLLQNLLWSCQTNKSVLMYISTFWINVLSSGNVAL